MKKLFTILLITPLLWACNSKDKSNSLLVNESQMVVDSIINRAVKIHNKASNPLQRDKIAQDLLTDVDSVYGSSQYLFKDIYGVIDDVNIYSHTIKGIDYSNVVASVVDRVNKDFDIRYKVNLWTKTDELSSNRICKVLCDAPVYSKVYITGLFDVNDSGLLNIEHSYMRSFSIACKHIDSIKLVENK